MGAGGAAGAVWVVLGARGADGNPRAGGPVGADADPCLCCLYQRAVANDFL